MSYITTESKLISVYQAYKDKNEEISTICILCYVDEGDEETVLVTDAEIGLPNGDVYETVVRKNLDKLISSKIEGYTSFWGTPIQTTQKHLEYT